MANILFLQAPSTSSRLGYDLDLISFLQGLGHTVTGQEGIEVGDDSGIDLVIWGQDFSNFSRAVEVALLSGWQDSGIPILFMGGIPLDYLDEFDLVVPTYSTSASIPEKYYVLNYDIFMGFVIEPGSALGGVITLGSPIVVAGAGYHYLRTVPKASGSGSPARVLSYDSATWQEFRFYNGLGEEKPIGHAVVGFDESYVGEDSNPLGTRIVWMANSAASGATPASDGYKEVLQYSINWILDLAQGYTASGGLALGGAADTSPGIRYPSGGLRLSGSATTFRSVPGVEVGNYEVEDGGLQLSGAAQTFVFIGTGFYDNERWSEIEDDSGFLFNRLLVQRNPLGSVDAGPETWGDLLEGNGVIRWDFLYDSSTGIVTLNDEELFTLADILKIDGTVDDRGYPLVVYELPDNEIFVYEWVHATQSFQHRKVAEGNQPFICFYGTRINSVGEPVLIYLDGNTLVERRGSESYAIPYSTSLVVPTDLTVKLEGLGQTSSNRLQFKVRISYER